MDRRAELGPAPDLASGPLPTLHRNRRWRNQHSTALKLVCVIIGASLATAVLLSNAGAAASPTYEPKGNPHAHQHSQPETPSAAQHPKPDKVAKTADATEPVQTPTTTKPFRTSESAFLPKTTSKAGHNIVVQLAYDITTTEPGSTSHTPKKQAGKPGVTHKPETSWMPQRPVAPVILEGSPTVKPGSKTTTTRPTAGTEPTAEEEPTFETCVTKECIYASRSARDKMNSAVMPCEDFYNYACGMLVKRKEIVYGENMANTLTAADHLLKNQLLWLLYEEMSVNDTKFANLTRTLYKSCMDMPTIEDHETDPLWTLSNTFLNIFGTLGGWPTLDGDKWNPNSTWSWEKSMRGLRLLGINPAYFFINVSVEVDVNNASRRIIYVGQPTLSRTTLKTLSKKYALNHHIVQIATWLGGNETVAQVELRRALEFEVNLTNISPRRNASVLHNTMSVKSLQSNCPNSNWSYIFNEMLMDTGIEIDENETIIVQNLTYVEQLDRLLAESDDRDVANYVMRRALAKSTLKLPVHLINITRRGHSKFNNSDVLKWICMDITNERLPIALGALYIRKHFSDTARRAASDMANEIKDAFRVLLKSADQLDNVTRATALEKLDSMVLHIGYPDELMDDKIVNEYYETLELTPNVTYLKTVLDIDRFATTKKFKKLRQPVNKTDWTTHSKQFGFGAFYNFSENSIQFPASYFQLDLFSPNRPKYMNYGGIGLFIAREITRGFYGKGLQFDKNGNPVEVGSAELADACLEEQYGVYMDLPFGRTTLVENIADNCGVKAAYRAYLQWAGKNNTEPRLLDLNLTPAQMFWLSAAQTLYSVHRSIDPWKNMAFGRVSPGQFRVLGSLSNSIEFSQDFNCPPGSPMNPSKKCVALCCSSFSI